MPRPAFLNLSDEDSALERARYALLPIPYDRTVTYKKGAARAPQAILEASTQLELWDEETGIEAWKEGIHTADPVTTSAPPDVLATLVEPRARELLGTREPGPLEVTPDGTPGGARRVLGVLGGEHSVSLGSVRAVASAYPDLAILHVDAHADVRAGFGGTEYGHGCIFRKIVEHAPVVQVGIRSASPGEAEYLAQEPRIRTYWAHQLRREPSRAAWIAKVMESLGPAGRPVYLSIDVDGLDPGIIPGTGTPEPGGLSWADLVEMIQAAAARFEIVAFDVVEVLPERDRILSEFVAARLVLKIISYVEQARRSRVARAASRAGAALA